MNSYWNSKNVAFHDLEFKNKSSLLDTFNKSDILRRSTIAGVRVRIRVGAW